MRTPYLVQSGKFREQPFTGKTGIDNIIGFDYMGSAEFEFGALPKSLARIRGEGNKYSITTCQYLHKTLSVLCAKQQFHEVVESFIPDLINKKHRLKERCNVGEWVYNENNNKIYGSDFWWDIDNDFMFWKSSFPINDAIAQLFNVKTELELYVIGKKADINLSEITVSVDDFIKLSFPSPNGASESLWVKVTEVEGPEMKGIINTLPIHLKAYKAGDEVKFNQNMILDYKAKS